MPVLRLLLIVLVLLNLLALAAGQGWLGTPAVPGEPERLTNQINPESIVLLPPETAGPHQPATAAPTPLAPAAKEPARAPMPATSVKEPARASTPAPVAEVPASPPAPAPAAEVSAAPATPAPPVAEPPAPALVETPRPGSGTRDEVTERTGPTGPQAGVVEDAHVCLVYADLNPAHTDAIERTALSIAPHLHIARETIGPPSGWWVRLPPAASLQAADRRARQLREEGITDLFVIREAGPNQFAISLGLFRTEASARQHLADLETRRVRGAEVAVRRPAVLRLEISGPASLIDRVIEQVASDLPDASLGECPQ